MKISKIISKFLICLVVAIAVCCLYRCADYDLIEQEVTPVTLSVTAATDSTVTLSWTKTDVYDFKSYEVRYSTSSVVDTSSTVADSLKFRTDTTYTVRNLGETKQYYFRVIVTTYRSEISPSNTVDTTTLANMRGKLLLARPDSISDTSALLSWSNAGNAPVKRYLVYMDTISQVDSSDLLVKAIRNDSLCLVTNLRPAKNYWFIVYAENDTGVTAISGIRQITTLSGVPSVSQLTVTSALDSTISVKWSKNSDADFQSYYLFYDTITIANKFPDTTKVRSVQVGTSHDTTATIESVKTGKKYYIRLFVLDKTGAYSASSLLSVQTIRSQPLPVTLNCVMVNDSTAKLSWSKSVDTDFLRYKVYSDTIGESMESGFQVAVLSRKDSTSILIGRLKPQTRYWFTVTTEDTTNLSANSNVVVNYAVILSVNKISPDSVRLGWTKSDGGEFESYTVHRGVTPGVDEKSQQIANVTSRTSTTFTDGDVVEGNTYYYKVYRYNKNSAGAGSNIIMVTVPAAVE